MASPIPSSAPKVRFGDFELDPSSGTIRKGGIPIKLQPQPFRVLLLLAARPGQIVSRGDIQHYLWGASTFVDFERGINFCINQIRSALCDSAEEPRYVETLPRVGYRFVASVTVDIPREPIEIPRHQLGQVYDWPRDQRALVQATPPQERANFESETFRAWKVAVRRRKLFVLIGGIFFLAVFLALRSRYKTNPEVGHEIRSLAVLPLENVSGDLSQDYFADGMTDAMITDLGKIGTLRVISRTSAMQYKSVHKPLPQIARELNVDAIVEGTVLRSGDRVRITAQLLDARADKHLWSQSYEGDVLNVLGLQSEVASAIASQIRVKLSPPQQDNRKNQQFLSPEAQDAYLRARYFAQKGTIEDLQKAVTYFDQAIQKEPSQASPYAGLASVYVSLGHILFLSPQEAFVPAKNAAIKALAIDDASAEAHTALANVKFLYDWDFAGAEREFQLALRLNPNFVPAHNDYSGFLNAMGKPVDAIARVQQTVQIDPLSLAAISDVAWELYWARRYDEAIEQARKVAEINPNFYPAHVCLGLAYEQKHDFPSAIAELNKATGFCRNKCFGLIGQVSALSGDRASALRALRQLKRRPYASPWLIAIVYTELGDKDQTFVWLEKAFEGREHDLAYSNVWPMFDSVRSDPRFEDLVRRIGLPQRSSR
jgi:TolB-like protein/DNA-binding winged helix-turn-helix (wHTH) protein/Flp pilus assembly protein TadD